MAKGPRVLPKAFLKRGAQVLSSLVILAIAYFGLAGRFDMSRGQLYFGLYLLLLLVNMSLFWKYAPRIFQTRSQIKGNSTLWDKLFMIAYTLAGLGIFVAAGYEAGRTGTYSLGFEWAIFGVIIFALGAALTDWAMIVNEWFEPASRLQRERKQRVVSDGPYAIIRHPGYAGMMLLNGSAPFILGSMYALFPALVSVLALIARTRLEDRLLGEGLPGYRAYARKTRYRLLPGIW